MNKSNRMMPLLMALCIVVGILIGNFYANHFSGNRLNIINSGSNRLSNLLHIIDDQYVDKVNNGVSTLFEVFIKLINEEYVKADSNKILEKIKKKDLDTLKAFLQSNCNSCEAANELYLHRNSFNYRMNSVSNTLNIDIRDINSMMFLNLIINICA